MAGSSEVTTVNCDLCFPAHVISGNVHIIPCGEIRCHAQEYAAMVVAEFWVFGNVFGETPIAALIERMARRAREDPTDWAACDHAYALWQQYKAK